MSSRAVDDACIDLCCSIRFTNPKGSIITEFKLKDCQPPSYRPEHEMRVVMRESIPRHLSGLLPPDSVRYDSNVVDVTADNAGTRMPALD